MMRSGRVPLVPKSCSNFSVYEHPQALHHHLEAVSAGREKLRDRPDRFGREHELLILKSQRLWDSLPDQMHGRRMRHLVPRRSLAALILMSSPLGRKYQRDENANCRNSDTRRGN